MTALNEYCGELEADHKAMQEKLAQIEKNLRCIEIHQVIVWGDPKLKDRFYDSIDLAEDPTDE